MKEIQGMKLYTSEEVAEMLGCSQQTLSRLRKTGKLRATQIGNRLYSSEEAIKDYLNGIIDSRGLKLVNK